MTSHPHHALPVAVPPANRFTILVVDDEAPLRTVICRSLDRIGYTTLQAKDPIEALKALNSGEIRPDLIISDVEMPEMSGIEMVSRIRSLGTDASALPIIVASGNPSSDMKRQAIEAGADLFLTKPFELGELYAEVGGLLRSARRDASGGPNRVSASGITNANRLDVGSGVEKTS